MLIFLSQGSNYKIYIFNVYIYILEKKIKKAGTCFLTDCIYVICPIANLYKRMAISAKRKKNSSSASKSSLFSSNISSYFYPLTFPQKYSTSRALQILIYVLKFRVASNLCLRGYAFLILHSLQFWSFFIASMSNISYRKGQG